MTSRRSPVERVTLRAISVARRLFRNSWIHRLPVTGKIYRALFHTTMGEGERTIDFRGFILTVATRDVTIVPTLMTGEYEQVELDLLEHLLQPGMTMVDIGANIGVHTLTALRAVGSSGTVVSFEPIRDNIDLLERNVSANGFSDLKMRPCAVGATVGTLRIYLEESSIGTHSAALHTDRWEDVDVTTLDEEDDRFHRKIDLLKVDVEGYEGHVLAGGRHVMERDRPVVFMEFDVGMLRRAGTDPLHVVRDLLRLYEYVYEIDERKGCLRDISPREPALLTNANIVASVHPIVWPPPPR